MSLSGFPPKTYLQLVDHLNLENTDFIAGSNPVEYNFHETNFGSSRFFYTLDIENF